MMVCFTVIKLKKVCAMKKTIKFISIAFLLLILSGLSVLSISFIEHFLAIRNENKEYIEEHGFPFKFHYESIDGIEKIHGIRPMEFIYDIIIFFIIFLMLVFLLFRKKVKRG